MRKNSFLNIAAALCMGAAALAMTACSSEDNIVSNDLQQNAEVKTYTVSIPATFGDGAQTRAVEFDNSGTPAIDTKFVENEKVYVYNVTDDELLGGYLEAKNVSADGLSCELKGTLTGTNTLVPDDKILLMYNLTVAVTESSSRHMTRFDYGYQQGTAATVIDGATSTMMVKDIDTSDGNKLTFYAEGDGLKTQAKALFANVQSMFRFQFSDGTDIINVKSLKITSKKNALVQAYYPLHGTSMGLYGYGALTVNLTSATTDYIYLGLCFDPSKTAGDVLEFQVTDNNGAVYSCSKAAPAAGFSSGKYYYSTTATVLTKHVPPTITYTASGDAVTNINTLTDGFDITMTNPAGVSNCIGSYYDLGAGGTLRLNGLTATLNDPLPFFNIASNYDDLTLDITGTNTITCEQTTYCFSTNNRNLKLSGNGTLTVRSKTEYGLRGANYAYDGGSGGYDVDQLPATGYTVTRSTPTDNGDGTYTCTYTVAGPATSKAIAGLTSGDIGWRLGSDGNVYSPAGSLPSEVSAQAVIAYVGSVDKYFTKFIAIALEDGDGGMMLWKYGNNYEATDAVNTYAAAHPVTINATRYDTNTIGHDLYDQVADDLTSCSATATTLHQGWRLPSVTDWRYIFDGLVRNKAGYAIKASYSETIYNSNATPSDPSGIKNFMYYGVADDNSVIQSVINAACGYTALQDYYWCSSGVANQNEYAWVGCFNKTHSFMKSSMGPGSFFRVRAVFAY